MPSAAVARCHARVSALAADALPAAREERDLVALLERVWGAIGEELAARTDGAPAPACGAGCATCCSLNVGTLAIEGAAAAALLRGALGAQPARALAARLQAFHDRVRWLEDRERLAGRLACPFVDAGGRCAIHPARPLACRGVTSIDRDDCRRAVAEGEDGGAPLVRMDLLHKALHDAALAALSEALQARGLDARCRDVSGMAGAFLADPGLVPAFLAGRAVPLE